MYGMFNQKGTLVFLELLVKNVMILEISLRDDI